MNRKRYIEILFECSKYISTININDMILSINLDVDDITFLDNINEFIHNLKQNEKIELLSVENHISPSEQLTEETQEMLEEFQEVQEIALSSKTTGRKK